MPRVALHCDVCDHELEPYCPTCRQRDDDAQYDAEHERREYERVAASARRLDALGTPGVNALEEILGVEVTVECDGPDEDGELQYEARVRWLVASDDGGVAFGPTAEEAVKALRRELIQETRAMLVALDT